MSAEVDFWSWVSEEKRRLDAVLEEAEEVPTLLDYLEREISTAKDTAFSLSIRGENGADLLGLVEVMPHAYIS